MADSMLDTASSSKKQSIRLFDQNIQRILQTVATTYENDQDIQDLLKRHSIVTHKLEEKLKDLLDANARIEDLHMEEDRLEKLVKKYQGNNYITSSTEKIISMEIENEKKCINSSIRIVKVSFGPINVRCV